MADKEKTERVDWEAAFKALESATYIASVAEEAKIRKDPSKGIAEDVNVPFLKPVANVSNETEASDMYTRLGSAAFNGIVNYAMDLKCRGAAAQAERAKLTADPLKKELKQLAAFDFDETAQNAYVEYRHSGLSSKQALAKIIAG